MQVDKAIARRFLRIVILIHFASIHFILGDVGVGNLDHVFIAAEWLGGIGVDVREAGLLQLGIDQVLLRDCVELLGH